MDHVSGSRPGWLAGFTGYLQADVYGGYDGNCSGGQVAEVACWTHARRKFFEATPQTATRIAERTPKNEEDPV